jgi:phosphate acyltransferase
MVTIALDAMGGDHFPKPEVDGALQAAKALGVRVVLVGREEVIRRELDKHSGWTSLPIEIKHASEQVTMEDSAGKAVRAKKDSSIRVASRLVREGVAQAVVSAGNTGAVMATARRSRTLFQLPPEAGSCS